MILARLKRGLEWMVLVGLACAVTAGADAPTRQQDLIGAWRLVKIEVIGPAGAVDDPFYGADSEGLMIYDRTGWFSVQIMGATRPELGVPDRRPDRGDDGQRDRRAAALDSYYAYYGTWTFDAATSTVTHHAFGALYPAERDARYAQHVEVHGSRMIFSRTQDVDGRRLVQRKIWQRMSAP